MLALAARPRPFALSPTSNAPLLPSQPPTPTRIPPPCRRRQCARAETDGPRRRRGGRARRPRARAVHLDRLLGRRRGRARRCQRHPRRARRQGAAPGGDGDGARPRARARGAFVGGAVVGGGRGSGLEAADSPVVSPANITPLAPIKRTILNTSTPQLKNPKLKTQNPKPKNSKTRSRSATPASSSSTTRRRRASTATPSFMHPTASPS